MSVPEQVLPASRQPIPGPPAAERPAQRTPAEIEQELEETTQRLAARVDELTYRLKPRQIARRAVARLQAAIAPDGRPKAEVVGATIGALVGVAVLVWRLRRQR